MFFFGVVSIVSRALSYDYSHEITNLNHVSVSSSDRDPVVARLVVPLRSTVNNV